MAQSSMTADPADSKSSLLEKLPPDLLRRLDQSLIDRDPPSYKAAFSKFAIQQYKVSYTAFYYYARKIRYHAALAANLRDTAPTPRDSGMILNLLHTQYQHML